MSDLCGHEDTSSGEPCKWNEAEKGPCPWHSEEADEDAGMGGTLLEQDPSVIDIIEAQLQNGDTVAKACAGDISEDQYYDWRRKGRKHKNENKDTIFANFFNATRRARKEAGQMDNDRLRAECRENGDTRTWYKLHIKQYGDMYGDKDTDMRDGTQVILHESAESYEDAIKN
jgi:transposase-like protein